MKITTNLTPVNHDSGRAGNAISGIVLHTMVGTISSAQSRFFNDSAQVSTNYGIGLNGEVRQWVRDSDTAYGNGNYQSNLTTISIEHEDGGDYNGPRTPQLYSASSELVADLCRRYGIPCDRIHIRGHREVIDQRYYPGGTACPDSLDMDRIIAGANALLNPSSPLPISTETPSATGETVLLPGDNESWRLYPLDVLPVVGNEKAILVPKAFGGLSYPVLGHPYPNVVTIQSQQFGTGNIWVGSDTNAQITAPPTPAPVAPTVTPAVPDKPIPMAKSKYERLSQPVTYKTNKQPTNVYNLDGGSWGVLNAAVVKSLNKDEDFVATGKAIHSLGGTYLMSAFSFGDADTTGIPTHNEGVNQTDLESPPPPPPKPTPLPTGPIQAPSRDLYDLVVAIPGYKTATNAGNGTDSVGTLDPDKDWYVFNSYAGKDYLKNLTQTPGTPGFWVNTQDNVIKPPVVEAPAGTPVTTWHTPPAPPVDHSAWQDTYKEDPNRRHWIVEQAYVVKDLAGKGKDMPIKRGGEFTIYGYFTKDNTYYARPQRTPGEDTWYGVPILIAGLEAGIITDVYNTDTTIEEKKVLHTLTYSHYLKLAILSVQHFFERLKDRVKNKQNKENET